MTYNCLADQELREGIKEYSEWPTIPQVYVKGEFVGGCDIVLSSESRAPAVFPVYPSPALPVPTAAAPPPHPSLSLVARKRNANTPFSDSLSRPQCTSQVNWKNC